MITDYYITDTDIYGVKSTMIIYIVNENVKDIHYLTNMVIYELDPWDGRFRGILCRCLGDVCKVLYRGVWFGVPLVSFDRGLLFGCYCCYWFECWWLSIEDNGIHWLGFVDRGLWQFHESFV